MARQSSAGSAEAISAVASTTGRVAHGDRVDKQLAEPGVREDRFDDDHTAEQIFAQHGLVFYRAATELEHAEWLLAQQSSGEARPLLDHARETFEQLEAKPWLERLAAAEATVSAEIPA